MTVPFWRRRGPDNCAVPGPLAAALLARKMEEFAR